jgi:hypothetical protein
MPTTTPLTFISFNYDSIWQIIYFMVQAWNGVKMIAIPILVLFIVGVVIDRLVGALTGNKEKEKEE